ncbi:hypothetical protein [Bradyrhizobium sp. HKCCYLS20291]
MDGWAKLGHDDGKLLTQRRAALELAHAGLVIGEALLLGDQLLASRGGL